MPLSEYSGKLNSVSRALTIAAIVLAVLYFGRSLFIPMSFGLLIAAICYPFCKWLEARKFNRSLAVTISLSLIVLLFGGLIVLLGYEMNIVLSSQPEIINRLQNFFPGINEWWQVNLNTEEAARSGFMNRMVGGLQNNIGSSVNVIVSATASTLLSLILVPIFSFLFLLHRDVFVSVLETIAGEKHRSSIRQILHDSMRTYAHFIKGTFFVYCIVGVLNSAGLLLLGIDHAVLFGMIAAFMTIIPYAGIIISAALPVSIALITKDSLWYAGGVVMVFTVVQYLEANIIYPKVVGEQLNLSTLAVLVTLIAGTILWGIAGMILFVPFAGLLKVVTDRIPELKALNMLLARNPLSAVHRK